MKTERYARTRTIAKNLGKLGKWTLLELLLIRYPSGSNVDTSISLAIGKQHGIGISMLCPYFLLELNLLPLTVCTHSYYIENC